MMETFRKVLLSDGWCHILAIPPDVELNLLGHLLGPGHRIIIVTRFGIQYLQFSNVEMLSIEVLMLERWKQLSLDNIQVHRYKYR